jgi:hypothetical protein
MHGPFQPFCQSIARQGEKVSPNSTLIGVGDLHHIIQNVEVDWAALLATDQAAKFSELEFSQIVW